MAGGKTRVTLRKQLPDKVFSGVVVTLAELDVPHRALLVDEILGGPVAVAVVRPRREPVVHGDRVGDAEVLRAAGHIRLDLLERVLGRVDADDLEPLVLVGVIPTDDVGDGALAVDAGVRPEVDEYDLAAQRLQVDRRPIPGVLSHFVMPVMSGAVPQLSSSAPPLEQFDSSAFWSLTRPPRLSFRAVGLRRRPVPAMRLCSRGSRAAGRRAG